MKTSHLSTHASITGFIVLVLGTIILVSLVEQYQVSGNNLLQNNDFSSGLTGWEKSSSGKITVNNNLINLQLEDPTKDVRIEQKIYNSSDYQYLRLAADIKTNQIVRGKKSWHRARLILSRYDENGDWLAISHGVAELEGTNDWQHFERIFKHSPLADQVRVIAMLHKASGIVWFKNISLTEVTICSAWKVLTLIALLGWGVFLFMILFPWVIGSKGILEKILIITVVFVIMVGTLIPHNIAERMKTNSPVDLFGDLFGDSFTDSFEKSAGNPCTSISFDGVAGKSIENTTQSNLKWKMINNAGHFILFLILAMVLLLFSFPNKNFPIFLTILMLGCATELMQFFIEGRGPGFGDLMLDIGGAFFGGLAARAIIGAKMGKFL